MPASSKKNTGLKAHRTDGDLRAEAALLAERCSAMATAQDVADQAGARLSELTARRGRLPAPLMTAATHCRLERDASETGARRKALLNPMGSTGDGPTLASAVEAAVAVLASNETAANQRKCTARGSPC